MLAVSIRGLSHAQADTAEMDKHESDVREICRRLVSHTQDACSMIRDSLHASAGVRGWLFKSSLIQPKNGASSTPLILGRMSVMKVPSRRSSEDSLDTVISPSGKSWTCKVPQKASPWLSRIRRLVKTCG